MGYSNIQFRADFWCDQVAIAGPIQGEEEVGFRLDATPHLRLFVVAEAGDLVFWKNFGKKTPLKMGISDAHMLHVWYIYLHLADFLGQMLVNIPYIEHMGWFLSMLCYFNGKNMAKYMIIKYHQ
jgi:hypothetical protein